MVKHFFVHSVGFGTIEISSKNIINNSRAHVSRLCFFLWLWVKVESTEVFKEMLRISFSDLKQIIVRLEYS